ncbi:hypothetical protein ACTXT7_006663 [Hymenolepis weldensis]
MGFKHVYEYPLSGMANSPSLCCAVAIVYQLERVDYGCLLVLGKNTGFISASKHFVPGELDGVCMDGRVALVTEANSGIGYCCSLALAHSGGEVDYANFHVHVVDMSEPKHLASFSKEFGRKDKDSTFCVSRLNLNEGTTGRDKMKGYKGSKLLIDPLWAHIALHAGKCFRFGWQGR